LIVRIPCGQRNPQVGHLPDHLKPEEFVSTVSEVRKLSLLEWVTKVTVALLCFLVLSTMGLYYFIGLGYAKLDRTLMTGLAASSVGQVVGIIMVIVRWLVHRPEPKGKL
jgi:hypothetical protein